VAPFTVGSLSARHRPAIEQVLQAADVFRDEELAVALELFDEALGPAARASGDYEFVGAFAQAGELAGYACFGPTPGTDGTYDLYWIAVHPAHQGRGAGGALLGEVERRLRDRHGRLVVIETSARDAYETTRRFYGRHGYGMSARLRDFYAPTDDRVIFTKHLVDSPTAALCGANGDE